MSRHRFTQFAHQRYLNLETSRKTGVPVTTPMGSAEAHGPFASGGPITTASRVRRALVSSAVWHTPEDIAC